MGTIYEANTQYLAFKCIMANTKPTCIAEGKPFTRNSFEAGLWFPSSPLGASHLQKGLKAENTQNTCSVFQPPAATAFILKGGEPLAAFNDLELCTRGLFPNTSEADRAQRSAQCPESHLDFAPIFL